MNNEYHDDLFSGGPKPPDIPRETGVEPQAPREIRIEPDAQASAMPSANGLGARLRAAREARGMDLASCSRAARLPIRVLQKLEAGDFGAGADYVFVRGALGSYARLLGIPAHAVDSALQSVAPTEQPALVPTGSALRAPWVRRYGAGATYIVLTAMVAVPLVWLGLRGGLDNQLTRIAPLDSAPSAKVAQAASARPAAARQPQPQEAPPLLASMTPFSAMQMDAQDSASPVSAASAAGATAAVSGHVLGLNLSADSWVEVADASGRTLQSGILRAGDQRSYRSEVPLNVTIGNADGVQVTSDGKPVSLAPYRHANVARFKVFDGASGNG